MKKFILIITLIVIGFLIWDYQEHPVLAPSESPSSTMTPAATATAAGGESILDPSRITKKPFGIYVSPGHSPVSPEKFTGYHTGTDLETTPEEADAVVSVPALCDGTVIVAKYASGYGGVAVESCTLDGQAVIVIYGHLKSTSIATVGTQLKKGGTLGILGQGYSSETDGERKHLHLGIHKGTAVNILGYVQNQADLSDWLDPAVFLE